LIRELFKTINSLNNEIICAQCSVSENDLSSLEIQTSFFLTDSIAEIDIAAFMEFSAVLVRRVVSQERLKSYVQATRPHPNILPAFVIPGAGK
jgi:hypothetical protein